MFVVRNRFNQKLWTCYAGLHALHHLGSIMVIKTDGNNQQKHVLNCIILISHRKGGWPETHCMHIIWTYPQYHRLQQLLFWSQASTLHSRVLHYHHQDDSRRRWITSGKHQTQWQNQPQLQNSTQPLLYLLHHRSWHSFRLLGCHPHRSSVQKSTPTPSQCNYVLLRCSYTNAPVSLPGDCKDMALILTSILVGTDAYSPYIINSVWGEDDDARPALGGPCGNLSLIRRHLLTLSKVAINTIHIWLTNPGIPILAPTSDSF